MRKLLILVIKAYQYGISPLLPSHCRYTPTCSSYAITAIERFGPIKGTVLAAKRISRCHPWGSHGYDPVPEADVKSPCCQHRQPSSISHSKL